MIDKNTIFPIIHNGKDKVVIGPDESGHLYSQNQITVEAWVKAKGIGAERKQVLLASWSPLSTFDTFDVYDAAGTQGLDTRGYFGAVFDGRYVYFSPQRNGNESNSTHGLVLRYDTHGQFHGSQSWQAYDGGAIDGLDTRGYYGAAFDGQYVYFVPRGKHYGSFSHFHSNVLRYDTQMGFRDKKGWDAFDIGVNQTHQGVAFDGRHLYFCPGYEMNDNGQNCHSGRVVRFDTTCEFKNQSSYNSFDVRTITDLPAECYDGGAFDGRYIYLVPLTSGIVARYDTLNDFCIADSWEVFDCRSLKMKHNVGAIFDGMFLYFVPYQHGTVIRYDIHKTFNDINAWESFDASEINGLDTEGFDGGFFDGRYIYFAPFVRQDKSGKTVFHMNFLRYDTRSAFKKIQSWTAVDAGSVGGLDTRGYNAGVFDGRFFYLAPWQNGREIHGRVLRYDTLKNNGTFCLMYSDYGHNGGLCAAVPGPRFMVNTENGVRSVAGKKVLEPRWHHLVGIYDGKVIQLFINGQLVNQRSAKGKIVESSCPVSVGEMEGGTARFGGLVEQGTVSGVAHDHEWVKSRYRQFILIL